MTKKNPVSPFESWDQEVLHRKQWTIKGTYLTVKAQRHMTTIRGFVEAHIDGPMPQDILAVSDAAGQCMSHKGILKCLGPARLKGGHRGFMFTPQGWEIYKIWMTRQILLGLHDNTPKTAAEIGTAYHQAQAQLNAYYRKLIDEL